jgi:hypothetical protein
VQLLFASTPYVRLHKNKQNVDDRRIFVYFGLSFFGVLLLLKKVVLLG